MPQRGDIYNVADEDLVLPPKENRQLHLGKPRPFLILSANTVNNGDNVPNVFGFPLSHKEPRATMSGMDVEIPEEEMGNLTERSWIRIAMGQPVPKTLLLKKRTSLSLSTLQKVEDSLVAFLAIY